MRDRLLILALLCSLVTVNSFAFTQPHHPHALSESSRLYASGMGMGGVASKNKKGSSSSSKKKKKSGKSGDANAALLKLEKKYEKLVAASTKNMNKDEVSDTDMIASEFLVAARSRRASTATADLRAVSDWVPVAQLCIARPLRDLEQSEGPRDKLVQAAIAHHCREISCAACLGSPKFNDVPRQDMEYSIETVESFNKHVYENFTGEKVVDGGAMTKIQAREILQLDESVVEMSDIKQSYRKLSFKLHPDRFVGSGQTAEEEKATNDNYARVIEAYTTLSSGNASAGESWYQSLGGKDRSDFVAPVELVSTADSEAILKGAKIESAVVGLDPDLVQMFVIRHQNS